MKKIFLLSVAGQMDEDGRIPQYPTGSVYTQQGQLFAVIALFENLDGIKKLAASLQSNNSIAVKAANAAIRKLELPDVHFESGKTVTYSRLSTAIRNEGRVVLYRTNDEYDEEERAYIVWKMGVNEWPALDGEETGTEWWQKANRIVQD